MTLTKDAVCVWLADLTGLSAHSEILRASLSVDEQERALRMNDSKTRERFELARGLLRHILSKSLGCSPESLEFEYGEHGKPALCAPFTRLSFNASHSKDLVTVAMTTQESIGIDIEWTRELSNEKLFAKKLLSSHEHFIYEGLPVESKALFLFEQWTAKEALGKATGKGISWPVQDVEALNTNHVVTRFVPRAGCVGAIATPRVASSIEYREWPEKT